MTLVNTQDLSGPALAWAVAKVERKLCHITRAKTWERLAKQRNGLLFTHGFYAPHVDWRDGGPILHKMHAEFDYLEEQEEFRCYDGVFAATGETHLISGMRCWVTANLGYAIEVPSELLET